jgi:futalosine hydrolase
MSRTLYLFSSELERNAAGVNAVLSDCTGVGIVDAGIGTVRALEKHRPAQVVFVGTCGAYPESDLSVGNVLVADSAILASGDVVREWMRFPTLLPANIPTDRTLSARLMKAIGPVARRGVVACTLGVTEENELALLLNRRTAADAENLEAFAVLRAAADIPTAVVLGVTNVVRQGGGREWKQNFEQMMRQTCERIGIAG